VKKFKAQLNYLFPIQKQEKKSVSNPKAMKNCKAGYSKPQKFQQILILVLSKHFFNPNPIIAVLKI